MASSSSIDESLLDPVALYPSPEASISSCASQYQGFGFPSLEHMPTSTAELPTNADGATLPDNFLFNALDEQQTEELLEMVHQPSTVAAPTTKTFDSLPEFIQQKLGYAIDEIKKAPSMMVLETQTPWCHPKLYEMEMPRSMQGMWRAGKEEISFDIMS